MNMRLDYTLYILAAIIFIITAVPFVVTIEGVASETRSLWVVTTVVLGLLSIGLGYSQRPKTEAQACEPAVTAPQTAITETQPAATAQVPAEEKTEAPTEKTTMTKAATPAASMSTTMDLTQVKGIGEKRAEQLKALGISNVDDLAKASAKTIAKNLKISPKTADRWVATAKELVK
jgi:predicted flap endonuclease-1-like 5' DNA nuclease